MSNQKLLVDVARADDLDDLLQHIAWEQTILPEIQKLKSYLSSQLVESVLGNRPLNPVTKTPISTEQIAGKVYGLEFVEGLFRKILKNGKSALDSIERAGVKLSNEDL